MSRSCLCRQQMEGGSLDFGMEPLKTTTTNKTKRDNSTFQPLPERIRLFKSRFKMWLGGSDISLWICQVPVVKIKVLMLFICLCGIFNTPQIHKWAPLLSILSLKLQWTKDSLKNSLQVNVWSPTSGSLSRCEWGQG